MERFQSGPPGGLTLLQTPTRLSDLVGGVYGPGASVASTGLNIRRPAIKAGLARAAGETWEDVLEYYLVCIFFFFFRMIVRMSNRS
jgi:SEL1 protein